MKTAKCLFAAGMLLLLCAAIAQAKPNFSGDCPRSGGSGAQQT